MGDWNSKHTRWNSRIISPGGSSLYSTVESLHLNIHVPPSPTHYPYQLSHCPDVLDFAISQNLPHFYSLQVLPLFISDHCLIWITCAFNPSSLPSTYPFAFNKIQLPTFQSLVSKFCPSSFRLNSNNDILLAINTLTHSILDAIDLTAPPVFSRRSDPLPPHIRLAINKHRKLSRLFKYYRAPFIKIQLNASIKTLRILLQSFQHFKLQLHLIQANSYTSSLYKSTRKFKKSHKSIDRMKEGNTELNHPQEIGNCLAKHFQSTFSIHSFPSSNTDSIVTSALKLPIYGPHSSIDFISPRELTNLIHHSENTLTPGPSGINNFILKRLPMNIITILVAIFNACLRLSYYPSCWKTAFIVPILEPAANPLSPTNYRPISLLSPFAKLFGKCLKHRLCTYFKSAAYFSPSQFGFSPSLSSLYPVLLLTNQILDGFHSRSITSVLALDLQKAFDSVWHDGLIYKLRRAGTPFYLLSIINYFFNKSTRQSYFKWVLIVSFSHHRRRTARLRLKPDFIQLLYS